MLGNRTWLTPALAGTLLLLGPGSTAQQPPDEPTPDEPGRRGPRKIGLVERAESGIAQLDVTVIGPERVVAGLSAEDFGLVVHGRRIEELVVDRVCREPLAPTEAAREPERGEKAAPPVAAAPPTTFLFYFDQHHLTMAGRQNSIDLARRMLPELIVGGNRAAVVSSGAELRTVVDLTDDVAALLEGLDRLEDDRRLWDMYAQQEELRIRDVVEILRETGQIAACGAARRFQLEEAFRSEKALRRFSMVLGLLADVDAPKAAVYFADTVRAEAGAHYYGYVGRCGDAEGRGPSSFGAQFAIDHVVDQATAHGIRLYTVQAEGLVTGVSSVLPGFAAQSSPLVNTQRISQAQSSLAGLALETGGRPFLNGVPAAKISRAIRSDLECLYLVSFDPEGLPLDAPLRVLLEVERRGVEVRTRGRIVLESERTRRTSRLLAAFATPGSVRTDAPLRGSLVPTGFENGRYTALVQIAAPGSPLPATAWDLGISATSRGEFQDDASGRITVGQQGVPVVFETEMSFRPGPFELIFVAHETTADQLGTAQLEGSWPERGEGPAVGPIAVVQPAAGVFLRDGELSARGALGRAAEEPLRSELPTALVGLVCRGPSKKGRLRVERDLTGEAVTEFPPVEIEPGADRCVQIRDVIPAATMTAGEFVYRIRVFEGERELAAGTRTFVAGGAGAAGG